MTKNERKGAVHKMPADLQKALASMSAAQAVWEDITPFARNEWICWATSGKKAKTRKHRIEVGLFRGLQQKTLGKNHYLDDLRMNGKMKYGKCDFFGRMVRSLKNDKSKVFGFTFLIFD